MKDIKVSNYNVFVDVEAELARARQKFPKNEHLFAALTEEVEELSQVLLQHKYEPDKGKTPEDIYTKAIQVAVMAIRVATEGDHSFPGYDPESTYRGRNWAKYRA